MALNFPASPSEGETWKDPSNDVEYTYNASNNSWTPSSGGGPDIVEHPLHVGPNEPTGVIGFGELWNDTSTCPHVLKEYTDCDTGIPRWEELVAAEPPAPPIEIKIPTIVAPEPDAGMVDVTRNPLSDDITDNNRFTAGINDWEPPTPFKETVNTGYLKFSGQNWVTVGGTGDVAISPDGVNWNVRPKLLPGIRSTFGLATDGNGTLLATFNSTSFERVFHWSYDHGETWTGKATLPSGPSGSTSIWDPGYNNGVWIIPISWASYFLSSNASSFGNMLSIPGLGGENFFNCEGDGSNTWIGGLNSGKMCRSTNNGSSFSSFTISGWGTGGADNVRDIHHANGMWVGVGSGGAYATSSNGTSWSSKKTVPGGSSAQLTKISYGNGTWYIIGNGTYWTSVDNMSSVTGPYPLADFGFSNIGYRPDRAEFIATGTITSTSDASHTFISVDRSELTIDGETDLDLFHAGDTVELDSNSAIFGRVVKVVKNGSNSEIEISPYDAGWVNGAKVKNRTIVSDAKPDPDTLVFIATRYEDTPDGESTPGTVLWEVKEGDSVFESGLVMSASKPINDRLNNSLDLGAGEGTSNGDIVLDNDKVYYVRATYNSTTDGVESVHSPTNQFKTEAAVPFQVPNPVSYYSENDNLVVDENFIAGKYGVDGSSVDAGIYELHDQPTGPVLAAVKDGDKYRVIPDQSATITDLLDRINTLEGN